MGDYAITLVENRTQVRRFYEEAINNANYALVREIFDEKVILHDPALPGGEVSGLENFMKVLLMYRSAFPDLHIAVEDQIVEGDKVVTRFTIHATHMGDLMGIKPSGKRIKVTGVSIIRFGRGKAVEEWIEEDSLGLMRQLGVIQ